jgi:23S rRNA (uracil1939-C5)-methyltransferase
VPNLQVNFRHKPVYRPTAKAEGAPPVGHFSQNNALANEAMLNEICRLVRDESVTDLYAGAGNISLPLARAGHTVTAVEVDPHLVEFGKQRAKAAGVGERLSFVTTSCEKWIESGAPARTVVLDPPRGGAFEVAQRLDPANTQTLVYVSCYPPTFARDAQALIERGYVLENVQMLDMFPQTYHAELVALFRAR